MFIKCYSRSDSSHIDDKKTDNTYINVNKDLIIETFLVEVGHEEKDWEWDEIVKNSKQYEKVPYKQNNRLGVNGQ